MELFTATWSQVSLSLCSLILCILLSFLLLDNVTLSYNKDGDLTVQIIDFGKARLCRVPSDFKVADNAMENEGELVHSIYGSLMKDSSHTTEALQSDTYLSHLGHTTAKAYTDERISPENEWIYQVKTYFSFSSSFFHSPSH